MKLRIMSVCAATTALAGAAWAGPVTYTFTGEVTSNTYTTGPLAGILGGTLATYQYTFQSTAIGSYASNATTEWYQFSSSNLSGMIKVGAVTASTNTGSIVQVNGFGSSQDVYQTSLGNTGLAQQVWLQLYDASGAVFDSSSISNLSATLDLNSFSQRTGLLHDAGIGQMSLLWTGLQIDNPVIPLPTGAAMAFVGLGVIGVRRRRNPME